MSSLLSWPSLIKVSTMFAVMSLFRGSENLWAYSSLLQGECSGHYKMPWPDFLRKTDLDGGTKLWESFCGLLEFLPLDTSKAPGRIFLECLIGNPPSWEAKNGRSDVHCCRLGPCLLRCWLDDGLHEVSKHLFLRMQEVNISHGLQVRRFWNVLWWVIAWFTFQKRGATVNHSAQGNCYSCNQIRAFGFALHHFQWRGWLRERSLFSIDGEFERPLNPMRKS